MNHNIVTALNAVTLGIRNGESDDSTDTNNGVSIEPEWPQVSSPPRHDESQEERFYHVLERANFQCEACETPVEPSEARPWPIRPNDMSYRNHALVCRDCLYSGENGHASVEWRSAVVNSRIEDSILPNNIARRIWNIPTLAIRFAPHAIALIALVVVSLWSAVEWGWGAGTVAFTTGYLAHYALWSRRDPRGYHHRDRPPWVDLVGTSILGLTGGMLAMLFQGPIHLLGLIALLVGATGSAYLADRVVRADRCQYVHTRPRALCVGAIRTPYLAAFLVGAADVAGVGVPTNAAFALLGASVVASGAYLAYRTTHDPSVERRVLEAVDRIHTALPTDLVGGGGR